MRAHFPEQRLVIEPTRQMTSEKGAQKFHTDDASHPDMVSASDWLNQISHSARPIRSTNHIWVVTHQYGNSALVSQRSFGGKTSGSGRQMSAVNQGVLT